MPRPSLETPDDWGALYLARGEDVTDFRPLFTGDIFTGVDVLQPDGTNRTRTVAVLQHPCALRADGVAFVGKLLVAEVKKFRLVESWDGGTRFMPLPELFLEEDGGKRNQAIAFESLYIVSPEVLRACTRHACLSSIGVNLLLQRWVHHNSRVIVPTEDFDEVTLGPYEETDLAEEWCEERVEAGMSLEAALHECHDWLREPWTAPDGPTKQKLLEKPQTRPVIRRAARKHRRTTSVPETTGAP